MTQRILQIHYANVKLGGSRHQGRRMKVYYKGNSAFISCCGYSKSAKRIGYWVQPDWLALYLHARSLIFKLMSFFEEGLPNNQGLYFVSCVSPALATRAYAW